MIDTFQISKTLVRPPPLNELIENGWNPVRGRYTTVLSHNSTRGEHKPRLTLSQIPNERWIIRAEVSPSSWLHGSNVCLPDATEIHHVLDLLSEYVENKSEVVFDAHKARVSRVDFTRDFQVGENSVIPIIAKFAKLNLPRYDRVYYGNTTIYFNNSGKAKTKTIMIYSKYHERLKRTGNKSDHDAAKGLIRLEVSLRKSAVYRLAKTLKLPSYCADDILTKETSNNVLQKVMKQLKFESLLQAKTPKIEKLLEVIEMPAAFKYIGYLYMKERFGEDFLKWLSLTVSPKTIKRYEEGSRRAGILFLE